jgi:hypothetical protein
MEDIEGEILLRQGYGGQRKGRGGERVRGRMEKIPPLKGARGMY